MHLFLTGRHFIRSQQQGHIHQIINPAPRPPPNRTISPYMALGVMTVSTQLVRLP